jgi:hypothetical protein
MEAIIVSPKKHKFSPTIRRADPLHTGNEPISILSKRGDNMNLLAILLRKVGQFKCPPWLKQQTHITLIIEQTGGEDTKEPARASFAPGPCL